MQLTEQQIKLFQEAFKKDFGRSIPPEQLLDKARKFYQMAEVIAQHLLKLDKNKNNKNESFCPINLQNKSN